MTQHTDLIERLTDEAYEWSRYVVEDRAPSTLSDYLEPHIKAVANALEAQAREIEGLRKDAGRWRWATEQAEFFSMVVDGTGLHCAEVSEAESAVDAAIEAKGQP